MQLTVTPYVADAEGLQEALSEMVMEGKTVALVPTMGALHAGHQSLIKRAGELADAVVVSIFVNPRQFGQGEDFDKYPKMLESDLKKAGEAGAAIVYAPAMEDIYPEGFCTSISVGEMGRILCGKFRPGHFDGVATVVAKLLLRTLPHVAVFGEKDYQQLCLIRRMVSDLDIAVEVVGSPTMREADGLALSSRNTYLSAEERKIAPKLHEVLQSVGKAIISGAAPIASALEQGIAALGKAGFKVDYLELREAETLDAMDKFMPPARLLAAAWLGKTRLIDNIALE